MATRKKPKRKRANAHSIASKKGWATRRRQAKEAAKYARIERQAIQAEPDSKKWHKGVPIVGWERAKDKGYRFRKTSRDNRYAVADPDYMVDLADQFDVDISDLYDMYYGYYED